MSRYLAKSFLLLWVSVLLCCGIYPLALWAVGQAFFPFEANGSIMTGPGGKEVGSRLIAQPFAREEYFHPRPSAASYDASASASSSLAASNYALRDRVARLLAPVAAYRSGPNAGRLVAPDVENWFREDQYGGKAHILAQWATLHPALVLAWVKADPANGACANAWARAHPAQVAQFIKENPALPELKVQDLAVVFLQSFSVENPGKFPSPVTHTGEDGGTETRYEPVERGSGIQAMFFLMWREDHPEADLGNVPGDMVTSSASGLDPHITLENAEFQLDRVASKWAGDLHRVPAEMRREIEQILQKNAAAPLGGLAGEKFVNVLEVNLELRKRYGEPS